MFERSVECSQCKKPAKIIYKEITPQATTAIEMCADCPILARKLHGTTKEQPSEGKEPKSTDLFCGNCHTSLEAVKMGNPLGCKQCYVVFSEVLIQELVSENKLPKTMENAKRNQPLHMGKTPGKLMQIPSSNRLLSLNEALNEALKKENYEEAAWLRDQIKELTKKPNEPSQ